MPEPAEAPTTGSESAPAAPPPSGPPSAVTPEPAPADSQPAPSSSDAPAAPEPAASAPAEGDPLALLDQIEFDKLTPAQKKKLRSHPLYAGMIGSDLERERVRLRDEAAKEARAQVERELETQRLRRAVEEEDLETLAQAKLEEVRAQIAAEEAAKAKAEEASAVVQAKGAAYSSVQQALNAWAAKQPKEVLTKFVGEDGKPKDYEADTYEGGLVQWLDDYVEATAEHKAEQRLSALRDEVEKELRTALGLEANSAKHGSEPVPDLGAGVPAGTPMTQDEWDRHRHDPGWRAANRARFIEARKAGRITH